ncbi:MAG: GNAT family N-acetyltransferase [Clostridia bacterium]|nr:GNAT family N-acetyltransferase [Clostridia bacterium]
MEIRYARPDELKEVNELRNRIRSITTYVPHKDMNPEFFKHVNIDYFSDDFDVLVVVIDDIIRGFAIVECFSKPESLYRLARQIYRIVDLGVDEAYRHQGIGTALVDTIRRDAIDKGFDRVELEMWEISDTFDFFEYEGFNTFRRFMELKL